MIITVQLQLLPTPEQVALLIDGMERFNAAANYAAQWAGACMVNSPFELRDLVYEDVKEKFRLGSTLSQTVAKQVFAAYKKTRIYGQIPSFREHSSVPFDATTVLFQDWEFLSLRFNGVYWPRRKKEDRIKLRYVCGQYQKDRLLTDLGESYLQWRYDGKWFLNVTTRVDPPPCLTPEEFIGVDLGRANLIYTSDGATVPGSVLTDKLKKTRTLKSSIHKKLDSATSRQSRKHCRRALARIQGRESRIATELDHTIAKKLVEEAKNSGRGIAIEDLEGLKARTGTTWAYGRPRQFISYKGQLNGVEVRLVKSRNTSRICSRCKCPAKENRRSQSEFECVRCGFIAHADHNAAINIAARALVSGLKVPDRHYRKDNV